MAKLYFYYASMNAGKSTTLLQADFNYRERGMETMLWTAALDDRYGAGQITSRIGLLAEAHKFDPDSDLWEAVNAESRQRPPFRPRHAVARAVLCGETLAHPLGRLIKAIGQEGLELEIHGRPP